ncbi:MAG TPA: adenylate/guanylate cyclase domain-containing protein [Acidimicrobiales bacterium]|nr:adenylate/guanylate cyclase domain-containing protein [Acidimicrobiales bacterium]
MAERDDRLGPFEAMTWLQAVRLVGSLLISAGVIGLLYLWMRPDTLGLNRLGIMLPSVTGLVSGLVMLLAGERFDRRLFYPVGPTAIVLITVGQYYSLDRQLGVVFYVWVAIFSFFLHPRRHAIVNVVLIGFAEAFLLAATVGNVAPFGLWLYVMSTVAIAAGTVSWLIDQINELAVSERRARAAAESAGAELAEVNRTLEERVQTQVDELDRLGSLRRFLAPQVADALLNAGEDALAPHRRHIAVVFCDLRGFTAFASSAEPEEVLDVLDDYYDAVGEAVHDFEATIGAFAGDGVMAYFNDPIPCENPAQRAVEMSVALRARVAQRNRKWQSLGHDLGVGLGIALGYASLGIVGFEDRREYTPLGTVVNLASRLCDEARDGQILVDRHVQVAVAGHTSLEPVGELLLKGFPRLVPAYAVPATVSARTDPARSQ